MQAALTTVVFYLFTYPVGIVIGAIFWFLRFIGIVQIKGWEKFPRQRGKVLLVSNHPSLVEPILLIGMFFHQYIFHPKSGPYTLADRKNYYDNWKFWLMRPRLIPVDRSKTKGDASSLLSAKRAIEQGSNIIMFPEGGRTWKGHPLIRTKQGKFLRPLKTGFAVLAGEPGVVTLPIWVEFGVYECHINIGKGQKWSGIDREEIVRKTEETLLSLADATN